MCQTGGVQSSSKWPLRALSQMYMWNNSGFGKCFIYHIRSEGMFVLVNFINHFISFSFVSSQYTVVDIRLVSDQHHIYGLRKSQWTTHLFITTFHRLTGEQQFPLGCSNGWYIINCILQKCAGNHEAVPVIKLGNMSQCSNEFPFYTEVQLKYIWHIFCLMYLK